ncbi:MAG: cupin domain-containing protein [Nitrospinae bacterium]|nr:cupin domain-containing protein [Nitrospinota bacterium]
MEIEVRKPTEEEAKLFKTYSTWECEPSEFPWTYDDKEICLMVEGQVTVTTDEGEVSFGAGDLVCFPAGLSCTWKVTERVRKHYTFKEVS